MNFTNIMKSSALIGAMSMVAGLSTQALAKNQFGVEGESEAYKAACTRNPQSLLQALQSEPEAREFLRLWADSSKSLNSSFIDANAQIFCHTAFVPKNSALQGIQVSDDNRDAIAMLLRSHFIGATFIEESDFNSQPLRLRSWSGNPIDLSRNSDGVKQVNGVSIADSVRLTSKGHTVVVIEGILPEVFESVSDAISAWRPMYSNGVTPIGAKVPPEFYPVLSEVTGKPGLSFNEIMTLCDLDQVLKQGNVTLLLPGSIPYLNAPILGDLWKSDKEFVCRAFSSNIIEGNYSYAKLLQLSKASDSVLKVIDGRVLDLDYIRFNSERFSFVQLGKEAKLVGPSIAGGTSEIVNVRETASYSIFRTEGFAALD